MPFIEILDEVALDAPLPCAPLQGSFE
jgi:hypothetical protein